MPNPTTSNWDHFWRTSFRSPSQQLAKPSWSKQRIIKIIAPYLIEGQRALDAGCGSGFFAKHFFDKKLHTTALDYSTQALNITQELTKGCVKTIQGDLLKDDLSKKLPKRFHLIFSDGLLEHFTSNEQDRIMQNFLSLLEPGGVVITFVPNRFSPWEIIRPLFMPGINETPFILKDLKNLNIRNGLHVVQSGGVNVLPFVFSPDKILGPLFGMLLFTVAKKR